MELAAIIEGIETADVLVTALAGSAAISEVLPHVKKVKANSTFQLCFNILKAVVGVFRSK
jgi:hypothetical protein